MIFCCALNGNYPALYIAYHFSVIGTPLGPSNVWISGSSCEYCSLAKECPPPTFGPISSIGSKFTRRAPMHPRESFAWRELCVANGVYLWSMRSTTSSTMHIWGKKLHDLTSKPLVAPRHVCYCLLQVALPQLNVETLERAPTPLIGGLVRCSAYGDSFTRLQYIHV